MQFGFGWIPDRQWHLGFGHLIIGEPNPPESFDRSVDYQIIYDQNPTSACVGFGVSRGIHLARLRRYRDEEKPSERWIYEHARRQYLGNHIEHLPDEGTSIGSAFGAIQGMGWASESQVPWDPSKVFGGSTWREIVCGMPHAGMAATRWLHKPSKVEIQSVLAAGIPIVLGDFLDRSWVDWRGGRAWDGMRGPSIGGHCYVAVDYSPNDVRCINSWGRAWGESGTIRITYDALANSVNKWIVDF